MVGFCDIVGNGIAPVKKKLLLSGIHFSEGNLQNHEVFSLVKKHPILLSVTM